MPSGQVQVLPRFPRAPLPVVPVLTPVAVDASASVARRVSIQTAKCQVTRHAEA